MLPFAPWAAALAGFRLVRERPWAVLAWAGVIFIGRLAGLALTTAISGPFLPTLDAAVNASPINVQAVAVAYQNVAPGYLAGLALALPFFAVVFAAVFRAYLQPQERRACYLRLGVREAAVLALIVGLNLVVMVGLSFGAALVAGLSSLVAQADAASGAAVEAAGLAGLIFAGVWAVVRLCLAWPLSFQTGRPTLFATWGLTRGHGWSLAGAFLMAEGLMVVVGMLLFAICATLAGVVLIASGQTLDQLPDALRPAIAVRELFEPAPLLFSAFEAVLLTLSAATLQGVAVSAYRALAPRG
ncbi:MAG TPA: hypothetical protein VMU59_00230 [Caulobacteraceae bacterium]|nr:hypothetical protein [Caulobacteraceae bacterium]